MVQAPGSLAPLMVTVELARAALLSRAVPGKLASQRETRSWGILVAGAPKRESVAEGSLPLVVRWGGLPGAGTMLPVVGERNGA